ncbi:isopentenyl-diphosphate delta-isomerase [candidate division WWE3 bacterium RIFCSPHIGHO2_01_FULL_35_17]|uniref:Isopentenyl-diphosphate delta-isomerase n=1 Tax=candidate division WWE3 bacterium RIFCSPHIGHO2_01_FULL_35_17 TaxID=1802614 RepID=A0A1F4UTF9_UNCKA|nr:MAG: isopentenyl-diphosphate delta-isomerase [candidate division WWE3 bacterium RIFCSPHIGHO2_01_FULL_35_17]
MADVILVDENDTPIGICEKLEAHKKKLLHRAFSVFIFNDKNELLLQRRAISKYHSGGLWTNTVCSHPAPGEDTISAAHRRLVEEMGFDTEVKEVFTFSYKHEFDNGITENEFDHVIVGKYNNDPISNPEEVEEWKWATREEVLIDIKENPDKYTYWFKIAFPKVTL